MATDFHLRLRPPERPVLRVLFWESSHGLVPLGVVAKLGFPFLSLRFGHDVAEDDASAVSDEIHEAFWEVSTCNYSQYEQSCNKDSCCVPF